jgi:hypothetical protein
MTKRTQSHQDKFHSAILRSLAQKFATSSPEDCISSEDKQLWEYFASLYKNANKGIRGRGKDRKVFAMSSPTSAHPSSYAGTLNESMQRSFPESYQHNNIDCSSRSLSASTDNGNHRSQPAHDFSAPSQTGYPTNSTGYNNMVFPERQMN